MRKSKLVVALGTTVALAALPLATAGMASASTSGSNSGSSVTRTMAKTYAPTSKTTGKFKAFAQPKGKYIKKSCAIDLSSIADFTIVNSVTGCGQTVTFSAGMDKRSVPGSWGTWGSPPDTETATPNLFYSNGQTSVTLTFSKPIKYGGVEAEPNPFEVHSFTAVYKDAGGKTLGTITRDADGNAGAKLFGAKVKAGASSFTISSDVDFGFAQIRVTK